MPTKKKKLAAERDSHSVVINNQVLSPDQGLLIGNGDLSVSIYQRQTEIVWRFGKGDVWDRRHETDKNTKPATMDEIRNGLKNEAWVTPAYGGAVQSLKGAKNPKRTLEILTHPESEKYPYPVAKPVGELTLHWPQDLDNLKITQKLTIEDGIVDIVCQWPDGEKLTIDCFVHPELNVLIVNWKLTGFHTGSPQPFFKASPLWLSLYRWPDPTIEEFSQRWMNEYNCPMYKGGLDVKATPLPPPQVVNQKELPVIEQKFYPEPTFPKGFKYWFGCISDQFVEQIDTGVLKEARLFISPVRAQKFEDVCEFMTIDQQLRDGTLDYPKPKVYQGWAAIGVTTSSDKGGPEQEFARIQKLLKNKPETVVESWRKQCIETSRKFWSASRVQINEALLEELWYVHLHVSKCLYRKGTIPPGLFMPSTIYDYSLWHGDYHTNYNIQQCFWGFLTANHPELDDAYFKIMDFHNYIGKKIAKDYCGTRGTFIQISGYPLFAKDDPIGTGCMGRMPYMTGWAPEIHWFHYLYTADKKFLREIAYPFIKDCALFYTDFLTLGEDGLYHAFPSCWGEEGYDGTMDKNYDALQTMLYADSSMRMAIEAAKILNVDHNLQKDWQERIDNLAPGKGESEWRPIKESEEERQKFNFPAFLPGENYRFPNKWKFAQRWWGWMDKLTISWIRDVRGGQFVPDKDFTELLKTLRRWRHPNGLMWPMPVRYYGRPGGWTEVLGIIEPLQEMMLQSWDKVIRIFPVWPKGVKANFEQLRAEGAFLVSAEFDGKKITDVKIKSLVGNTCNLANPWSGKKVAVINTKTKKIVLKTDKEILTFETKSQMEYNLRIVK
jgi:hypothetical protein